MNAEEMLGKWVRVKSDIDPKGGLYREPGRPFKVWQIGNKEKSGRQRILGPVECVYSDEVDILTSSEEEKAREEWEHNVR